jgi:hypothetical protein
MPARKKRRWKQIGKRIGALQLNFELRNINSRLTFDLSSQTYPGHRNSRTPRDTLRWREDGSKNFGEIRTQSVFVILPEHDVEPPSKSNE